MFIFSLYPLILRASRITTDSVALIDNIFVNQTDIKAKSGILITIIAHDLLLCGGGNDKLWWSISKNGKNQTKILPEKKVIAIEAMKAISNMLICVFGSVSSN